MKTLIILFMLFFLTSVASAEIYTWEDVNVIHFTDTPPSIPDEYRDKEIEATSAQNDSTAPQDIVGITQQNRPVITHVNQTAVYQADLEQQRRAAVTIKKQQARASAVSTKIVKDTFPSLASLVVVWFIIALFLIITWVLTIVDIVRSNFIVPSVKTGWMLLVIFVPLIGMLLYYIIGLSRKGNSNSFNEKHHFETLARFNPR